MRIVLQWENKAEHDKKSEPSSSFDIREIKVIEAQETVGNRQFALFFMNEKFKLELKAATPDQCREWIAILEAKRQLHNQDFQVTAAADGG